MCTDTKFSPSCQGYEQQALHSIFGEGRGALVALTKRRKCKSRRGERWLRG